MGSTLTDKKEQNKLRLVTAVISQRIGVLYFFFSFGCFASLALWPKNRMPINSTLNIYSMHYFLAGGEKMKQARQSRGRSCK